MCLLDIVVLHDPRTPCVSDEAINELMYFLKEKKPENRTRDLHLHVVRRSDVKPLTNIGQYILSLH